MDEFAADVAVSPIRVSNNPKRFIGRLPGRWRAWSLPVIELGIIAIWTLWLSREYLDFDPTQIPFGREFLSAIQSHSLWTQFQKCGWCAVWSGFTRGGYPAFADVYGSMLHPLVVIATLAFGIVNGAKVAMVAALWVAGLGQWWLARLLGVGRIPALWSALVAVAGGHLAGRMENGVFGLLLSTAVGSLVLPGLIMVAGHQSRRAIVLAAISIASLVVAGQGYIQISMMLILPAISVFLFHKPLQQKRIWRKYVSVAGLAFLLAAPFVVPVAHFLPQLGKDFDPQFLPAQSIIYAPLNLVISDLDVYYQEVLGTVSYPYIYTLYIGWMPVLLAIFGLANIRQNNRREVLFLVFSILILFIASSRDVLSRLVEVFPLIAGIRNPSLLAGLAVPAILGLSACGLDRLLKYDWPALKLQLLGAQNRTTPAIPLQWVLVIPLIAGLRGNYQFARIWLHNEPADEQVAPVLEALKSPELHWVGPPFGEHFFVEPAIERGLKVIPVFIRWNWRGRIPPEPELVADRVGAPPGPYYQIGEVNQVLLFKRDDVPYASVVQGETKSPCLATGSGGTIEVRCNSTAGGKLVIEENMYSGWRAWRDGKRVLLIGEQRLTVDAPAGEHTYLFRYLPWDVPLGIILLIVGVVVCAVWWVRAEPNVSPL